MDEPLPSTRAEDGARAQIAAHVRSRAPALLEAWQAAVRRDPRLTTNRSLPRVQLLDHLPRWLEDLAASIATGGSRSSGAASAAGDADQHGLQRWQQGFDVREVAREWAWLHEIVVAELDAFAAATPTMPPAAMTEARLCATRLQGDAIVESVARYVELDRLEAAGSVSDLERALDSLRDLEKQRASLWHEAAHDLRGNLGVVVNVARGLSFADLAADRRDAFLQLLMRNLDSLHRLLDDVTGLARLHAGHEQRLVETFDAAAMLTRLADEYRPLAEAKQLALDCVGPPSFPVEGDPVKTRRIAQNLLINAIKYTVRGSVSLFWGAADERDDARWTLGVRDTGPGFHAGPGTPMVDAIDAATDAARAPDAAARPVDDRPVRQEAGEGIGLAIVKRLAEVLDATVEVESAAGQGTFFRVVLPRRFPA